MAVRLEVMEEAKALFGDWQETIIWSCLQQVMGAVYADSPVGPKSAMALLGDFCFLAGEPDKELALFKPEDCRQEFMIMVPQNDKWAEVIAECYGSRAKEVTRYAFKKEGDIFDRKKLLEASRSLGPEYELKLIDREGFALCRTSGWGGDMVSQYRITRQPASQYATDYDMYRSLGLGVAVFREGELVAGASSYSRYRDGVEIEIDTRQDYRRRGLAYACGAAFILECLERDLYPSWDAQNLWSAALAEKLGYHFDHAYRAYEIRGY